MANTGVGTPALPRFPHYLADTYGSISREIDQFEATEDDRNLLRALRFACEGLSRLQEDSDFWENLIPSAQSLDGLFNDVNGFSGTDYDTALDELLDAERHLLTEAGMPPRDVARLLNDVETAERTLRSAGQDGQSIGELTANLRNEFDNLQAQTCALWEENRGQLEPSTSPSDDATVHVERRRRVLRIVKRVALVAGGAVVVAGDVVAFAHAVIPPTVAGASAKFGFDLAKAGVLDQPAQSR